MLKLVVRSPLIADVQRLYRERSTYGDLRIADKIRQMRLFLEYGAKRFEERQRSAMARGKRYLRDGRADTLEAELFGPLARNGWPSRVGGILHGLQLHDRIAMDLVVASDADQSFSDRDPHSYWAVLQDGPDQARTFGELVAIAVYFDPFQVIEIVWIGPTDDAQGAWQRQFDESGRISDWSRHPNYAAWLRASP